MNTHRDPKRETPSSGGRVLPVQSRAAGVDQLPSPKAGDLESPTLNDRARGQLMNDNRLVSRLPADSPRRKPTLSKIGG
jgi:hypothetical protein